MTKRPFKIHQFFLVCSLLTGASFLEACKDEIVGRADLEAVPEEALTESFYQDLDDLSNVALQEPTDNQYAGGRTAATITVDDDRFDCNNVVVTVQPATGSTLQNPQGVITIDFGTTGCADPRNVLRQGKLHIAYSGRRFMPNSRIIITPENYSVSAVKIEGVRTSVNVSTSTEAAPSFHVTLTNGRATFPDGTTMTRTSDITWTWKRNENPLNDERIVSAGSTASGTTRTGIAYSVSVDEDLVYQRTCLIAVDGVKDYIINNTKDISVDYGYEDCQHVSITANRVTKGVKVY
ncbi:hypothetical protein [Parachryseolinea silvisoli]|uniref:hypothetical protein n=1 Tax=Parachryseolinea silvisoli TaxID=2873601 RepID=UPI002265C225|nr:hypothetical protein [Parachryseolinea silvisoli]MCD9018370.1 hypothetical protein [Parachryseolinea silvisoli]